jgi:MFS family permease
MATGFGLLSFLEADTPYWFFVIGLVLFGIGMGLAGTPSTTAITSALPPAKQGVASALNDTAREVGSAFGIAILGSVLNGAYRDGMADAVAALPAAIADRVLASIAFTAAPEVQQAGPAAAPIVAAARDAFVGGVGDAVLVGSVVLLAAAGAVFVLAPRRSERSAPLSDPLVAPQRN